MEDKQSSRLAPDLPPRAHVKKRARLILAGVGVVLALLAVRTVISNIASRRHLDSLVAQNARSYVRVVQPKLAANGGKLVLPGTLRGYVDAPIYARASGYVKRWDVDIGAHVKQGQVLAELDTPDLDQELVQAQAQRQQAEAALALARTSYGRAKQLRSRDAVSQQELDDREGAYNQDVANLAAADANMKRLSELKRFQNITAPVDGVVTQRNVDIGDLVTAGNSGAGRPLFTVVQADRLRLYVQVPQANASQIKLGEKVSVVQPEFPDQSFEGKVTQTAQAIDVTTRTLQTEITLPNADGRLMPGAYVTATLLAPSAARFTVPSNVLLFRSEGASVAVVDANGRVRIQPIVIARTLAQSLEVASGVSPGERLVLNPDDSLATGDIVTVMPDQKADASAAASGAHA
ncbi:MAG TPA: efflux RND transporter periplasmic adaptor subunit [Paraburkholderia sp.]